ncbi:Palmitoyl-protein thioesterase 1 [Umbelopsis sp. WA50703]
MSTETAVWEDLTKWQREIDEKDKLLSRKRALRDRPSDPISKINQIDLATAKPLGLSALKEKIGVQKKVPENGTSSTNVVTANSEKELGNNAFQARNYELAVDHYTKAIELDNKSAVYYINRAMAYLKLEKYAEAERDSSSGLSLQPNHVKALYRRGIARRQLDKLAEARADLTLSLSLSPQDSSIKAELEAVRLAEQQRQAIPKTPKSNVQRKASPVAKETSNIPTRRLDIKFEDSSYVHSKEVVAGASTSSAPPVAARNRANAAPGVPPVTQVTPPPPPPTAPHYGSNIQFVIPKEPKTMNEFTRDWRMCRARGIQVLYRYMKAINPERYQELFKAFLESEHLDQMIEILDQCYESGQDIKRVLEGLLRVKRIDMLIMFLERKQIEGLKRVFRHMEEDLGQAEPRLRKLWSVET